jgi:hypothetical protein
MSYTTTPAPSPVREGGPAEGMLLSLSLAGRECRHASTCHPAYDSSSRDCPLLLCQEESTRMSCQGLRERPTARQPHVPVAPRPASVSLIDFVGACLLVASGAGTPIRPLGPRIPDRCQRHLKVGSGPDSVMMASGEQDALAEQIEVGPAVHLSFDHFDAVHVTFHWS